jgi:hypothetical protein
MSAFLTVAEVETLTGYRRPSAQVRFLKARRIRHVVNAAGHPVIARSWIDAQDADVSPLRQRPNLRAIPGAA